MSQIKDFPYGRQTVEDDDISSVLGVLQSSWLTQGPMIEKFEEAIARYCNVKYAIAFSSGTAALHAACFAAGVSLGDEVITTPLTFAASANCVLYLGGKPVFADIHKNNPLIDYEQINLKITQKTKAIIPVDYSGLPADYRKINAIAKKNNLVVISDAAHSLGAYYYKKKVGELADMTVFSFHPVKTITTGEGGMVVTNNKMFYEKLLQFRTHGITKNKKRFENNNDGPWYYEMQTLGYNYRLTDIQAALGYSQTKKIDTFVKKRQEIASHYNQLFKNSEISIMHIPKGLTSSWHLYPILIPKEIRKSRRQIFETLHKKGIKVQVHYIPVHLHPYYRKKFGYKPGDFINSEDFYERELSLPIYPILSKTDATNIAKTVIDIIKRYC